MSTSDADLLTERYGIEVAGVERLPGYDDENHLVTTRDGERYVLKWAKPGTERLLLEGQTAALQHLAAGAPHLTCPRVVPTRSGATICEEEGRLVRLLTWLPGKPLAEVDAPAPALLEGLGAFLGGLDRALLDFSHAGLRRTLRWDLLRVLPETVDLGAIRNVHRRRALEHMLSEFEHGALADVQRLRRGVIHNDANDQNILVGADGGIAGLFDFGDMLESVLVGELAVAATYAMLDRRDPLAAAVHVATGYHGVLPLEEAELAALYPLICARLCLSVVHSARATSAAPDNEYVAVSRAPAWRLIERLLGTHPDALLARLQVACGRVGARTAPASAARALEQRRAHVSPSLSLHYAQPLKLCRGVMQHVYDEDGRAYLDLVNNVSHVGHGNPRVVRAAARQMARLNTNTRYLHDGMARYAERLVATLPDPLEVCFFVCTGSEANELALRLARAHTGLREMLVVDHADHGHTSSLVDLSPYKHDGKGGRGAPDWVRAAPMPDPYRGPHREADAGARYAARVAELVGAQPVGAFFCESLLGCGGQIVPPPGFMADAFAAVRAAGGVCVADEVQVGFGRVGTHFWAFEAHGVVPDIVTLGKPIGNGHPLAAVVTTRAIAESFANGMEYFNTFGGNPVSCAVGEAVLDVIESDGLQRRALELGARLLSGLRELEHPVIGDVRGLGLFLGLELVRDRVTLEPADRAAAEVVERMKSAGFLLSTDGPLRNVIKLEPPLVLTAEDVDATVHAFGRVFAQL